MGCHLLEVPETTEEVVYSWHNKSEVPQAANCGLKFLGDGSFIQEEPADVCCPGNKSFPGREIISRLKLKSQPRMTFNSAGPASALSLSLVSMLSRGVGFSG